MRHWRLGKDMECLIQVGKSMSSDRAARRAGRKPVHQRPQSKGGFWEALVPTWLEAMGS